MTEIHEDRGYDHDRKYSEWRRCIFPKKAGIRNAYCTDIDWIEWRNGNPVAIIECRRAIGNLRTAEEAISHFKRLNYGFQYEVIAHLAQKLGIKAYIVGIEDPGTASKDYSSGRFLVEEVIPPNPWPVSGAVRQIGTRSIVAMSEDEYVQFIKSL
jgi:hypothetical protein